MRDEDVHANFAVGDLVFYKGFEIFPTRNMRRHLGIIVEAPSGLPHRVSYRIYWFESRLTTRMHYDMIELVYEHGCSKL